MYLSYSGWKLWDNCAHAYLLRYVTKPFLPAPDNKVNSLFGSVEGRLFEMFYAEKLWQVADPTAVLLSRVEAVVDETINREIESARKAAEGMKVDPEPWATKAILWKQDDGRANYESREDLIADVMEAVPRGVEIIRVNRLIGPKVAAELKLDTKVADHYLVGRADFVVRRAPPENDLIILDGKGSRHGDKYVDDEQLRWYAMLWRERSKRLPDGVGFVLWRKEPEEALVWVAIPESEIDGLRQHVIEAAETIEKGRVRLSMAPPDRKAAVSVEYFQPHPGPLHCKLCAYIAVCPSGQMAMEAEKARLDAEKAARRGKETPGAPDGPGVEDVGL